MSARIWAANLILKLQASQPIQASDSWQRWKRWAMRPTPTILCRWVRNEDYRILCIDHEAEFVILDGTFPIPVRDARSQNPSTLYPTAGGRKGRRLKKDTPRTERGPSQKPRKA